MLAFLRQDYGILFLLPDARQHKSVQKNAKKLLKLGQNGCLGALGEPWEFGPKVEKGLKKRKKHQTINPMVQLTLWWVVFSDFSQKCCHHNSMFV